MSKFKIGDKVYSDKRGLFGSYTYDWTLYNSLGAVKLEKNRIYTIIDLLSGQRLHLDCNRTLLHYHEDHFKKYEEEI